MGGAVPGRTRKGGRAVIQTHCPLCGASIVSLIGGSIELHGCPVDEPGHFFARVEREAEQQSSLIPAPLPISALDTCYNGACGNRVEFQNGLGCCSKCGVHQRYVAADAEFIESVTGRRNVVSFAAKAGKVE